MTTVSASFGWIVLQWVPAGLLLLAPAPQSTSPQTPTSQATDQKAPHREAAPEKSPSRTELALHAVELQIIESTNAARARHGLPPLSIDTSLVRSARSHTIRMIRMRSLVHTTMAVAENIAKGQSTAHQAVGDWMNSPGHRANILSRSHGRIGVAAYLAPDGMVYWCQQFLP